MSDEIVDVSAQEVNHIPEEKIGKDGLVIPDIEVVESPTGETIAAVEQAREDVSRLPEYPKEWQEGMTDDSNGFAIGATVKEKEINKLIKKYKRYMKSNLTEVKRLES
jgi:hypothetical protein